MTDRELRLRQRLDLLQDRLEERDRKVRQLRSANDRNLKRLYAMRASRDMWRVRAKGERFAKLRGIAARRAA